MDINIIVPAIIGFLTGVLGTLFAPWVNWGIEKRRKKLEYRQELIKSWRKDIDENKGEIRETATYAAIRVYLLPEEIQRLEPPSIGSKITIHLDSRGTDHKKLILLDAVTRIEKEWKLV